jgi:hypothetical protein
VSVNLFILYRQDGDGILGSPGVSLDMGANTNRPGIARTFTRRADAVNYARKHGAKVAQVHFPDFGYPAVLDVINPADPAEENRP